MMNPLPAGSLVTGTIGTLVIRSQCRGHIWRISEPVASNWSSGSGWLQAGTCLVCEYTTAPMDCEWWQQPATIMDVANCAAGLSTEIARLHKVWENLLTYVKSGSMEPVTGMLNFE
jgi:hypothetical protein